MTLIFLESMFALLFFILIIFYINKKNETFKTNDNNDNVINSNNKLNKKLDNNPNKPNQETKDNIELKKIRVINPLNLDINKKYNILNILENIKLNNIKPISKKLYNQSDLIDILFSVQDLYQYNPLVYDELMDNIDGFFYIQENIFRNTKLTNYYYQIAESKKDNIVNNFHSLIFSLPSNKFLTDKFNKTNKRLETILNNYLNEMYDKCTFDLMRNGYDIYKRKINKGPKEYNNYPIKDENNNFFNKDFTYQFY